MAWLLPKARPILRLKEKAAATDYFVARFLDVEVDDV
jgi:hypothetical protein